MTDDISESERRKEILNWAGEYATNNGYILNPDPERLEIVIKGLLRNKVKYGEQYCPCRLRSGDKEQDKEIICPCAFHRDEIKKEGNCHCHLFFEKK